MTPLEWLKAQQSALDALIADAALAYPCTWPPADLQASAAELYGLSAGLDVCYDRPSIGVPYALYYQGRRIHDALRALHDEFLACPHEPLEVVDLGVGTGATPIALALLSLAYADQRRGPSRIRVIGLDASAFMIAFAKHLLVHLHAAYPRIEPLLSIDLEVNSWRNADDRPPGTRRWLVGNYAFDHSERAAESGPALADVASRLRAQTVFLQGPRSRRDLFSALAPALTPLGLTLTWPMPHDDIFKGPMPRCAEARATLDIAVGHPPEWEQGKTVAAAFVPIQPSLLPSLDPLPDRIDLFLSPVRVRRDARLTPEQDEAATPDGRPTLIVGPAGCGKSLVLTERIKRLVLDPAQPDALRVLVTTFNKDLTRQLANWLQQVLVGFDLARDRATTAVVFVGPRGHQVRLMNFDKIPTRLFGVTTRPDGDPPAEAPTEATLMREAIDAACRDAGLPIDDSHEALQPAFLRAEYARVFYGQQRDTPEAYRRPGRVGRGPRPRLRGALRTLVCDVLTRFDAARRRCGLKDFTGSRLDALRSDTRPAPFTHLFYDEFQDLTPADFALLYRLVESPNNVVIAGDLAQAFFVGRSYDVPRMDTMAPRNVVTLTGSHRVPTRVSEALRPLAERIVVGHRERNGIAPSVITPSRWAAPGARPIVIFGHTLADLVESVRSVLSAYARPLDLKHAVVLERDDALTEALNASDTHGLESITTGSVKTLKGLERDCVLWASWQPTPEPFADAALEMVYTALTRSTALLVLMLSDAIALSNRTVLGLLDDTRLHFWGPEAKEAFDRLKVDTSPPSDKAEDEADDEDEDDERDPRPAA